MIRKSIRNIAGTSLIAAALGVGVIGAAATANATTDLTPQTGYSVYTCYDYATQTFYYCV